MRYFVKLHETELAVDITAVPGGGYDVRVDDCRVDCDIVGVGGAWSVRVGNSVFDLALEGELPEIGTVVGGYRGYIVVESEQRRCVLANTVDRSSSNRTDSNAIVSPMPGQITKVVVGVGDEVSSGDVAVVIESMKMECELCAPRAGRVEKILAAVGDKVENGAVLVELT